MFTIIETIEDLSFLNQELLSKPFIALDTEFRRTTKDNMKLALLQINDLEEIYLIDAVKIKDPDINCSFLFSNEVIKIIHSCREDLEAVYAWTKKEMTNIFDTQLAHSFLGGSLSISYQNLVTQSTGLTIEKNESRTNWLRRPLSEAQLSYAASDVLFLINFYEKQKEDLKRTNKINWFEEEQSILAAKSFHSIPEILQEKKVSIPKIKEKAFLKNFNDSVEAISKKNKINKTLFFSKQSQKDLLRNILSLEIEDVLSKMAIWRRNLIQEDLLRLLDSLEICD